MIVQQTNTLHPIYNLLPTHSMATKYTSKYQYEVQVMY